MHHIMQIDRPIIRLKPKEHKRVVQGHPWIYSNEIVMDAQAKALAPGSLVFAASDHGALIGTAMFNPNTLIAARILERDTLQPIDRAWFKAKLARALALRAQLFNKPFYRLVHAEADGLPGLVLDRYGDVIVAAIDTAGMAALAPMMIQALQELFEPTALLLSSDSAARRLEGLQAEHYLAFGHIDDSVLILENDIRYCGDLLSGQKTGWFFDQRDNRAFAGRLSQGRRVLDVYCYSGGFALACAHGGASSVYGIDRSAQAVALAMRGAIANAVADRCRFESADAFSALSALTARNEIFDMVIADPPAFAKSRKDLSAALKGYRKLSRLCADCVAPGGILVLASCSYHVSIDALLAELRLGLSDANRSASIIRIAGAGSDHPLHPHLPESQYLKAVFLALD